jgi:hypothetical protein
VGTGKAANNTDSLLMIAALEVECEVVDIQVIQLFQSSYIQQNARPIALNESGARATAAGIAFVYLHSVQEYSDQRCAEH